MSRHLLILGWHNVEGTFCFPSPPGVGTSGITAQFELLARTGNVVSLPEAVATLEAGGRLPARAVAITFDDGYRDNVELAAPILAQLGLPATFFLVPDMLSGKVYPWWEELGWGFEHTRRLTLTWEDEELSLLGRDAATTHAIVAAGLKKVDEPTRRRLLDEIVDQLQPDDPKGRPPTPIMDWDGARKLEQLGFTIGSHSRCHSILANESAEAQLDDLLASRLELQDRLKGDINVLAYPNGDRGDFNQDTTTAAKSAGYQAAVTTVDGWNTAKTPRYALRRFVMYPEWRSKGFGIVPRHVLRTMRAKVPLGGAGEGSADPPRY